MLLLPTILMPIDWLWQNTIPRHQNGMSSLEMKSVSTFDLRINTVDGLLICGIQPQGSF